jgi:hypothetical protein
MKRDVEHYEDKFDKPEKRVKKTRRLGTKNDLAKFHIQAVNSAKKRVIILTNKLEK